MASEEIDLYEVLSITKGASKSEIKKAYHKAALSSHPDKVAPEERETAEIRFKAVSQAYEILSDDQTRTLYDQHGMAAFEKGGMGGGPGPDMEDILAQMFGGTGFGGGGPFGGAGRRRPGQKRPKGQNQVMQYEVTLEELYKGKTTKFTSTKNVICSLCKGTGGKEKAQPKECGTCQGRGVQVRLVQVGPGMVTQQTAPCSTCNGQGKFYGDKDKCKKCKGARVLPEKKILELYVPKGAKEGDTIVLAGEADQNPDEEEPGDIIFQLVESAHDTFNRAGADLQAEIDIDLSEALTGFNRVVLTHLDGRGISLKVEQPDGRVIRPSQILKVPGEGMPMKRSDARGDLYLVVNVLFPADGWLKSEAAVQKVRDTLPRDNIPSISAEDTEEVEFDIVDDLEGFGAGSGDPRAGAEWEDEDGPAGTQAQCAQQ